MDCVYRLLAILLFVVGLQQTAYSAEAPSLKVITTKPATEVATTKPQPLPVKAETIKSMPPNPIKVGIHVMSINQFDLFKGSYDMDLHLQFRCQRPCPNFNVELLNGDLEYIKLENQSTYDRVYRISAMMYQNFNVRNYPFDHYWLLIEMQDQDLDEGQIKFIPDRNLTVIDPRVVMHGWQYKFNTLALSGKFVHPLLKDTYSTYIFMIELRRPPMMGFLKFVFPASIIMFFAFVSFFISADKSLNRFGIVSGSLLGSVLFHLNLTSSLPPLGYLTFADTFMIICYVFLFIILFENVYIMRLADDDELAEAEFLDKITAVGVPFLWLVVQMMNAFLFHHLVGF